MHVGSTRDGSSHGIWVFCNDLYLVWGWFWPTFVISGQSFIISRTFEMAWVWVFKYWFPTGVDLTTYRVTWSYDTMSGQAAFVIQGQGCFFALRRNDCVGRHLFLHVLGNWVFLPGMTFIWIACNERYVLVDSLVQCFSTAGPRPGSGPWHQLYRAARMSF